MHPCCCESGGEMLTSEEQQVSAPLVEGAGPGRLDSTGGAAPATAPLCGCPCGCTVTIAVVVALATCALSQQWLPLLVLLALALPPVLVFAVIFFFFRHNFQVWALQRPGSCISRFYLPIIAFIEGMMACNCAYVDGLRQAFGPNFCCAGQVVVSDWKSIERDLTSPQARTSCLGAQPLMNLPGLRSGLGDRNLFLLALSDQGAGGTGAHHAFKSCMAFYLFGQEADKRQQDQTSKGLLEQLRTDYLAMQHGPGQAFYHDNKRGLTPFLVRYLHYVLFGLDPNDQATTDTLLKWYSGDSQLMHYLYPYGHVMNNWRLIAEVDAIYARSPALAGFKAENKQYYGMKKEELCHLASCVMRIAGITGTKQLATSVLGGLAMPAYEGYATHKIDVTRYLDALDLDNRQSVVRYMTEVARLHPPVNATHRVATETFDVNIGGKRCSFPQGTKMLIAMVIAQLDTGFWGTGAYEFNPERPQLLEAFEGFHSVGERSAGRMCPGRKIATELIADIIQTLGRARRQARGAPGANGRF